LVLRYLQTLDEFVLHCDCDGHTDFLHPNSVAETATQDSRITLGTPGSDGDEIVDF
jgi:hypothetical protein